MAVAPAPFRVPPRLAPLLKRPLAAGAALGVGLAAAGLAPITFPTVPLVTGAYIALGADLTANPNSWVWETITGYVLQRADVSIVAGRRDEASRVTTANVTLQLDNRDARFTRRNTTGPYFGLLSSNTPIRLTVNAGNGEVIRFEGYVSEWPTRWPDLSGAGPYVVVKCAGVLRRLGQGDVTRSALFQTISGVAPGDYKPREYWSMEDGSSSTRFASALPDGQSVLPAGTVTFAADSALPGSSPLPQFAAGSSAGFLVRPYADTGNWLVSFAMKIDTEPVAEVTFAELGADGTAPRITLSLAPGTPSTIYLRSYDISGALLDEQVMDLDGGAGVTEADFYGQWLMHSVAVTVDTGIASPPGDDQVWYNLSVNSATEFGFGRVDAGSNAQAIRSARLRADVDTSFGHLAVFTDAINPPDVDDVSQILFVLGQAIDANNSAMDGHVGEQAHERIARLCREQQVPFTTNATRSALVGVQPSGKLVDLLRECELADHGVLYETGFGLGYQALDERLNAAVAWALDFDQRHIMGIPEPADNDQRLRNRWTITRRGGSSGTFEDATSAMGTGPGGPGVVPDSGTRGLYDDDQPYQHAAWLVREGTVDEDRYPLLPLKLHGMPNLIPGWIGLPYGARITVANPPYPMPSATIDAIVEGWTERWNSFEWHVSLNTSPASPYQNIGIWDDPGSTWDDVDWGL